MDFLIALGFGAGVGGFAYSRMGRRVGYGNTGNVALVVGVIFLFSSLFFFTLLKFIFNI
jgi:hypothetical protein